MLKSIRITSTPRVYILYCLKYLLIVWPEFELTRKTKPTSNGLLSWEQGQLRPCYFKKTSWILNQEVKLQYETIQDTESCLSRYLQAEYELLKTFAGEEGNCLEYIEWTLG